mmetsp:Transcript_34524/g.79815  ORF Transcript_34524/g.79815 Transcript_34524/m.79815 type:complete len:323 (-) Transcript_34524:71-1039(-)
MTKYAQNMCPYKLIETSSSSTISFKSHPVEVLPPCPHVSLLVEKISRILPYESDLERRRPPRQRRTDPFLDLLDPAGTGFPHPPPHVHDMRMRIPFQQLRGLVRRHAPALPPEEGRRVLDAPLPVRRKDHDVGHASVSDVAFDEGPSAAVLRQSEDGPQDPLDEDVFERLVRFFAQGHGRPGRGIYRDQDHALGLFDVVAALPRRGVAPGGPRRWSLVRDVVEEIGYAVASRQRGGGGGFGPHCRRDARRGRWTEERTRGGTDEGVSRGGPDEADGGQEEPRPRTAAPTGGSRVREPGGAYLCFGDSGHWSLGFHFFRRGSR